MKTSRRNFISKSLLAIAGIATGVQALAKSDDRLKAKPFKAKPALADNAFKINIFSKNLHWLNYADMAEAAATMGFDGVDLTVRTDGHVVPEKVEEDLPKAVAAIRNKGMDVYMITTSITDANDQFTERILKTASSLHIPYYRMGWINYDNALSIEDNLEGFKKRFNKLALLNKKYNIHGGYQNHSGASLGAPLWDLYTVLKDMDPQWIGSQYDILHATVEGANSWPIGLKLLKSYIKTIDIKDFNWIKKEGKWAVQDTPLTQGMVDFKKYFNLLKEYNIAVPVSLHFEYPLGGAENGAKTITRPKDEVLELMKKDLVVLKSLLQDAALR